MKYTNHNHLSEKHSTADCKLQKLNWQPNEHLPNANSTTDIDSEKLIFQKIKFAGND